MDFVRVLLLKKLIRAEQLRTQNRPQTDELILGLLLLQQTMDSEKVRDWSSPVPVYQNRNRVIYQYANRGMEGVINMGWRIYVWPKTQAASTGKQHNGN